MPPHGSPAWNGSYVMATPRIFPALGIPLKRGRLLNDGDVAGTPLVAVISETAARLYWPADRSDREEHSLLPPRDQSVDSDCRRCRRCPLGWRSPARTAVDLRPIRPSAASAVPGRTMTFVLRAAGDPLTLVSSARAAVASVDSGLPLRVSDRWKKWSLIPRISHASPRSS